MVKVRTKTRRMLKPQLTISRNPHDLRHPVIWCHYTLSHTTIPIHLSHTSDTIICVLPRSSSPTKHRRHHHRWSLIQITGSSTTDDAQITKNEKSSLQKNSTGKKDANWKTNNCSQIFFSLSYSLSSSPPPELSHVVTPPWGVTAACVFPAPFRAQYLLEYCFSWMRSWVRAFRFLYESFAESKKKYCYCFAAHFLKWWDMSECEYMWKPNLYWSWVAAKQKNTRTRIPPRGVATTFFTVRKTPHIPTMKTSSLHIE